MRPRFKRTMCASSRGAYVHKSHIAYIMECHERNKGVIAKLSITIEAKPKYFVKCFGKLYQITEEEAMTLDSKLIITI